MKTRNIALKYGSTALVLAALTSQAHAAIDVTAVVTEISGTLAPIGLIGAGVLLVMVAIKAFKWVRGAM
jgi:hypothetical protein